MNPAASEGAAAVSKQWIINSDFSAPLQGFNGESVQINLKKWQSLAAEVFRDGFGSRLDMQFLVNVPEMGADGVDADAEFVADLLVRQAPRQAIQHGLFAGRELVLLFPDQVGLLK